jgi:superfamily II DNA/RNA helicase
MQVFSLQSRIINQYKSFLESFIRIKNTAIREQVENAMKEGKLLPEPLLQFNPAYENGGSIEDLCHQNILEPRLADILTGYTLYRHQLEAINLGSAGKDFVVTSGTGSGKSLTYIATIFNHILRNPKDSKGVRAIIVYPMNALINSQEEEFAKYEKQYEQKHGQGSFPISFAKYTGQEKEDRKQQIKKDPPDILLTNYMMLELIMTRSSESFLRENIQGNLEFLAFDELHTYRGRQGSDIAILIRRIRAKAKNDIRFMGTSATLVSSEIQQEQKEKVAQLARIIFGQKSFSAEQVINESLKVQTVFSGQIPDKTDLKNAIKSTIDKNASEELLRINPIAVWLENRIVLERKDDWIRRGKPLSLKDISQMLAEDADEQVDECSSQILNLLDWSEALSAASSSRSIFPFKLHQFISQTGSVYVSLDPGEKRFISLDPGYYINAGNSDQKPIFPVVFSRISGHDFICVRKNKDLSRLEPRGFHDTLVEELDIENLEAGYLIIPHENEEIWSDSEIESLPDAWIQFSQTRQSWEAKPDYRKRLPQKISFDSFGYFSESEQLESWGWYMPAKLLFDPTSGAFYDPKTKEGTKLMTLGNEGRSSATTILSYAIVNELSKEGVPVSDQKVLSFTDNRQDAALQAGHFNDFLQVVKVRSAIYHALRQTPNTTLDFKSIADSVFSALDISQEEYAQKPASTPGARRDNEDVLKDYIMTRILLDLKRGWRVIMPNLEQCGLLRISYKYLDQEAQSNELWSDLDEISQMPAEDRFKFLENVLDFFRTSYAIFFHKLNNPRQLQSSFLQTLKQPWSIESNEELEIPPYLRLGKVPNDQRRSVFANSIGSNSALGKYIKFALKSYGFDGLKGPVYANFVEKLMTKLEECGFLRRENGSEQSYFLWQLDVSKILWTLGDGQSVKPDNVRILTYKDDFELEPNAYFKQLYMQDLRKTKSMEGREHTGQLRYDDRIEREDKFRKGEISALFCSPTMELGIDIKNLNVVHMRNVPPSPANYAQRSGRAGRSGQGALVFTYCSAFAPHDRHYFKNKEDMIAGVVSPPRIDLMNRDLLLSHVNATYLSILGLSGIERSISEIIDLDDYPKLPLKREIVERIKDGHEERCSKVLAASKAVLGDILDQLMETNWYTDDLLVSHIENFLQVFDKSLGRWRELYVGAKSQLANAQSILGNPVFGPNSDERRNAWRMEKQTVRQLDLLRNESGNRGNDLSEFYPYRYLASEGFLPGYNFTRLPLRTFLSGDKMDGDYVSRARFTALKEFGPRNIVYHNGAKYNILRMNMLNPESQLQNAKTSKDSGYFFIGDDFSANLCPVTGSLLDTDAHRDLLMDLVPMSETTGEVQERISCEEEERTSTGFDIKTYFSVTGGFDQTKPIEVYHGKDLLLRMYFIPTANIIQVNTRWRRSQKRGFPMGLRNGYWKREKEMEAVSPNAEEVRRVMPYTTGNADSLYIQPVARLNLDASATSTFLYALKRAVENLYQVESNEIGAYIMGETERPNILLFEAAEGSLGILSQLARDPEAFPNIVKEAYKVCWFENGVDVHPQIPNAPVASYDDLLSYYNQRDHDRINRFHIKEALELLMDCHIQFPPKPVYASLDQQKEMLVQESDPNSTLEQQFIRYLHKNNIRMPDSTQTQMSGINGLYIQPDFIYEPNVAIFIDGSVHDKEDVKEADVVKRKALRNAGWQVLVWRFDEPIESFIQKRPDIFYKVKSST